MSYATWMIILITGSTDQEHLENLEEVLSRLKQHSIRLKKNKCQFLQDAVEYLGHQIDAQGIRTATSKLEGSCRPLHHAT